MQLLRVFVLVFFLILQNSFAAPPYPSSAVITGVTYEKSTLIKLAPGSDNFQVTWADDNHQYAAWGDGGGFGGTNSEGRVRLGVARIEGPKQSFEGFNVWGGFDSENPNQFKGKSWGMLCLKETLYMWVTTETHPHIENVTLAYSKNKGATWVKSDVVFNNTEHMTIPTFLNYGKNYSGAIDGYVYSYFIHSLLTTSEFGISKPGKIYLSRVPIKDILNKSKYEYYTGIKNENPVWSSSVESVAPVFTNKKDGVGWNLSVSYNIPLKRFLLMTEHTKTVKGYHGIYDAPTPWGPWTTVEYVDGNWLNYGTTFYRSFSNKWLSADGKDFVMIFTGTGSNDAWNSIEGSFTVKNNTSVHIFNSNKDHCKRIRIRPSHFSSKIHVQLDLSEDKTSSIEQDLIKEMIVKVYDVKGQGYHNLSVNNLCLKQPNLLSFSCTLEKINAGVCFLRISTGAGSYTKYFILNK